MKVSSPFEPLHNALVANEIKLKQLKRDRVIALQIQRMLEAGAIREVGVVTTVKNKEYGFIRAQDRKEELYFRLDDLAEENVKIEEVRSCSSLFVMVSR